MSSGKNIWVFMLLVLAVPLMAYGLLRWYEKTFEQLPVYANGNATENLLAKLASFELVNQQGRKLDESDWNNKIVVADFFFTHCTSVCPRMTASLKNVQQSFAQDTSVRLVSFTVDPERDSSIRLKEYAGQFSINAAQWNLVTGSKHDLYKLARNAFHIVATDGDGGANDFIHSDKVVLVDRKKRIRGYYDGTANADIKQLITDIKKLENEH